MIRDANGNDGGSLVRAEAAEAYVSGNFGKVQELMAPLAQAGEPEAQVWLALLYLNGQGVEADAGTALAWFLRAAESGHVVGQANAGALLLMGKSVTPDAERGVALLNQAAEQGDMNALFNLGVVYSSGEQVRQDLEKAADCYRRAAEVGHYPSQSRLGYMYAQGRGVAKDRVQAFLWLTLAAQHGIGTALNALEGVVKAMSAEEKAEGMSLYDQWRGRSEAAVGPATIVPVPI